MRTLARSREHRADLLARPPCLLAMYESRWADLVVDPTEQLTTLADLLDRGLLSAREFKHVKARVLAQFGP